MQSRWLNQTHGCSNLDLITAEQLVTPAWKVNFFPTLDKWTGECSYLTSRSTGWWVKKNLPLAYFTNVRPLAGANSEPLLDTADDETLANSCQSEKRRERYQSPNHTDSPPRGADERDVEVWQRKKTTFNVIYLTRKKKPDVQLKQREAVERERSGRASARCSLMNKNPIILH